MDTISAQKSWSRSFFSDSFWKQFKLGRILNCLCLHRQYIGLFGPFYQGKKKEVPSETYRKSLGRNENSSLQLKVYELKWSKFLFVPLLPSTFSTPNFLCQYESFARNFNNISCLEATSWAREGEQKNMVIALITRKLACGQKFLSTIDLPIPPLKFC